jgi:Domain of unknown function (DUF397)
MNDTFNWRKSSYSGQGATCVEVACKMPDVVAVRDSKNPDGPKLVTTPADWRTFLSSIRAGRHDLT